MSGSQAANSTYSRQEKGGLEVGVPFQPKLDSYSWCLTSKTENEVKQSFVWAIENFSELPDEKICSSEFPVRIRDGLVSRWRLEFYPMGIDDETSGHMPVYLCNMAESFHGTVKCELGILKTNQELTTITKQYPVNSKSDHLIATYEINTLRLQAPRVFPNDTLTFVCNLSIKLPDSGWRNLTGRKQSKGTTGEGVSIKQLQQQMTIFLEQAHLSPDLSDCKIVCEGEELSCHTFVLAARSPVFRAMFTTAGLKEATTRRVEIDSMKLEVVKDMLSFIYTGNTPNLSARGGPSEPVPDATLNLLNAAERKPLDAVVKDLLDAAEDLLDAAEQYQLDDLKMMCEDKLLHTMQVDNAVHLLILGDRYAAQNLKKEAISFILRKWEDVVDTSSWKDELFKFPNLLAELFLADKKRG